MINKRRLHVSSLLRATVCGNCKLDKSNFFALALQRMKTIEIASSFHFLHVGIQQALISDVSMYTFLAMTNNRKPLLGYM